MGQTLWYLSSNACHFQRKVLLPWQDHEARRLPLTCHVRGDETVPSEHFVSVSLAEIACAGDELSAPLSLFLTWQYGRSRDRIA